MLKTYHGSCHCAVQFEADIDLSKGTLRCNCSICMKARIWSAIIAPDSFKIVNGDAALTRYEFHTKTEQHLFCKVCGIRPFGIGRSPRWGEFYAVNVSCLDDATDDQLANVPVTYVDGRHDDWDATPAHIRQL